MNFTEKNNFVVKHASAKYFYADKKIYAALFPESKLNADLAKANQFTHKKLDERMLLEILSVKGGAFVLKSRKGIESKAAPKTVSKPVTKAKPKNKPVTKKKPANKTKRPNKKPAPE